MKSTDNLPENTLNLMYACEKYNVFKLDVKEGMSFEQKYPFLAASVLEGAGEVDGKVIRTGDHFILSADYGSVEMTGDMSLILSTVEVCADCS